MFVDTYADIFWNILKTSLEDCWHSNSSKVRASFTIVHVTWCRSWYFSTLAAAKNPPVKDPTPKNREGLGQQKLPIAGRHCSSRCSCSGSWYALARYWNGSTFDTTCCGAWSSDFGAWSSDSQHACAKGREIWEWFEWSDKHGWIAGWQQWDDLVISRSTCHKKCSKHRNDENGKNRRY